MSWVTFDNGLGSEVFVTLQDQDDNTIQFNVNANSNVLKSFTTSYYKSAVFAAPFKTVTVNDLTVNAGSTVYIAKYFTPLDALRGGPRAGADADALGTTIKIVNDAHGDATLKLQPAQKDTVPALVVAAGQALELYITKETNRSFTVALNGRTARVDVKDSFEPVVLYLTAVFPTALPSTVHIALEKPDAAASRDEPAPPYKSGARLESYV